jgi:hypothetical protein
VYADWLQSRGDPRGELIVRMVNDTDPLAYMKKHKQALYGGLIGRVVPSLSSPPFIWEFGFIHRVELERERKFRPISPVLDSVLAHPSGALVTELQLGSDDLADIRNSLERVVRAGPPLRELEILSGSPIGDLTTVLQTFRDLEVLSVKIRARRGDPDQLDPATLHSIAKHAPASLRRLEIRVGSGRVAFVDLAPLFARTDLVNLTSLAIRDVRFGDQLVDAVIAAPFAAQLTTLDLCVTELDEAATHRLAAGRAKLVALKELAVSHELIAPSVDLGPTTNWRWESADTRLDSMLEARFRPTWE